MDWLLTNIFPNFIQNLGIIATLLGFVFTIIIWFKTGKLYKIYNSKTSTFYIVDKISSVYTKYSNEIKKIDKNTFQTDINQKELFSRLIKEVNGIVTAFEDGNQPIKKHLEKFSSSTINILNTSIDNLTYDKVWNYYNYLTKLSEILKNIQDMNARKITP